MGEVIQYRQRALLAVVDELSKREKSSRFMLEKNMFLLKKEELIDDDLKFYSFFPYKYGPFSNLSFIDLNKLGSKGYLNNDGGNLKITDKAKKPINSLKSKTRYKIIRMAKRFDSDKQLKDYVYTNYPEYTVKSNNPQEHEMDNLPGLFTIGYEGRDIDAFLDILIQNNIDILVDVRRNPFSMVLTYTKKKLSEYLQKADINYLHIPKLGIDGSQRQKLETKQDYEKLFEEYMQKIIGKQDELNQLRDLSLKERIALMCFERSPDMCHRGEIAKEMRKQWGSELTINHL
jgi:uncharacterized protein (DUF488 family)